MLTPLRARARSLDERARGVCIGGARVLVALMWLANLHWKVPPDFGKNNGGGLYKYSASVSRHSPFAPFTWFTEEIVLPNFRVFGWVTLIGELVLAMLLLVGYHTKTVALVGAFFAVPIMLSVLYYDRADEWSWSYLLMIAVHVLLYATDAGRHLGLDSFCGTSGAQLRRGLPWVGGVAVITGVLGLFVARSIDFAGDRAALLGSDAGFRAANGALTRRWELKFLWFNPLWAVLTILFGALLVLGTRKLVLGYMGAVGFAAVAVVAFLAQTFDYVRDDGAIQVVSTAANVAVWGAFAFSGLFFCGISARNLIPRKA